MIGYIARRLGLALLVVAGVVVLTFVITRYVPGDPAASWAGPRAGPTQIDAARRDLGLDRPLGEQIVSYAGGVLRGDWGTSVHTHEPVLTDLTNALPITLQMVLAGLILALAVGVPAGLVSARWRGRLPDHLVRLGAVLGAAMPVFWLAMILQASLSEPQGGLPVGGSFDQRLAETHPLTEITGMPVVDALLTAHWPMLASALAHLVLPAVVVAAYPAAVIARIVRASVLDTIGETHIQHVRALGFAERTVFGRFAMRSAWSPVAQVTALVFAYSLVNAFLVESIFNLHGLGGYAADSVSTLDVPAIVGITLLIAIVYVAANLAVDLVQAALDPRVRLR